MYDIASTISITIAMKTLCKTLCSHNREENEWGRGINAGLTLMVSEVAAMPVQQRWCTVRHDFAEYWPVQ